MTSGVESDGAYIFNQTTHKYDKFGDAGVTTEIEVTAIKYLVVFQ